MSREPDPQNRGGENWRVAAAVFLALLAPALGGGTSPGAQALLLVGAGLAAIALPARRVRTGFLIGAGLLVLVTLDWAWPAGLSGNPPWRDRLSAAGFPLGWCISPEPGVSLRAWLLLLCGVVWAAWCAGQAWSRRARRRVCEALALGIGLIAIIALAGHVPGWPAGTGLGPFENRNQTATLFATGAFLTFVCGIERFRRRGLGLRKAWGLAWLCLLGAYTVALAVNRSRAGALLLCGMTLAWSAAMLPVWRRNGRSFAVGLAIALLLAAVFLVTGQELLKRLAGTRLTDFRFKIFSDTATLIRASPWTGTGLGCFDAIFPLYRSASILEERVLHPESDWLWLTAEAGLPALTVLAALAAYMGKRAWQARDWGEDRAMQLALCVACAGVLAHSFLDVPGHRLGTAMPALLLLGLAVGGDRKQEGNGVWSENVLRGAGLAVLLSGLCGLAVAMGTFGRATPDAALAWSPLDWRLYFEKARTEGAHGQFSAALRDFRRARFLEPNYSGLPYEEGLYWLEVAPRLAIEPLKEALRRVDPARRPELYQNILAHAYPAHPELHADLSALASDDRMELVYLGWATPDECKERIKALLEKDPQLSGFDAIGLRKLFQIWMNKGDSGQLASLLPGRPEWLGAGFRALAEYDAAHGDVGTAVELMVRYLPKPRLPLALDIDPAEASRRFTGNGEDLAAGMALYQEATASGRDADAFRILQTLSESRQCPAYLHYLKGQLLLKLGKPGEAWNELRQYSADD